VGKVKEGGAMKALDPITVLARAEAFMRAHPEKFEHVPDAEQEPPVRVYWNTMGRGRAERDVKK